MTDFNDALHVLLLRAVERAEDTGDEASDWRTLLENLDVRIRRHAEELAVRTVVPKDLRDDYRREIDTLLLDNMTLTEKLSAAEDALKEAKIAYREETRHSMMLEQRLDDMEQRLTGVIKRRGSEPGRI